MIGTAVGPYQVISQLGSGGMGVVYRGEDTRLGRAVALKFLLPGVLDEDAVARFRREARAASALNHPHICTVYDVGDHDGAPYLVLEYLEGDTLAGKLRGGPLPVDTAVDVVAQLADALACAHAAGIVHRDVKSGNVFITSRGDAKMLDFGLAKRAEAALDHAETVAASAHLTHAGTTLGTVAYMSPEQARAEEVDHRSDIFSLGVVLYEALTGSLPFRGSSPAVIFSEILGRNPAPPSQVNRAVPPELDRIVTRALEKDRELRYQTAADLRADLKRLRQGSGATSVAMAAAPVRRGSSAWLIAGVAVVAAVAAAGGWLLSQREEPAEASRPLTMKQLTNSGNADTPVLSPDGKSIAYVEQRADQYGLYLRQIATGSTVPVAAPTKLRYAGMTFTPDGDYVYATRATEKGQELLRIPALGGEPRVIADATRTSPVAFSPDGRRMAFLRIEGGQFIVLSAAPDGSEVSELVRRPDSEIWGRNIAWSPDGLHVAGLDSAGIMVLPAGGGEPTRIPVPAWKLLESLSWQRDGSFLITGEPEDGEMTSRHQILQVPRSGDRITRLTNDLNDYHQLSVSRDGMTLAATQMSIAARLYIFDPANPANLQPLTSGRGDGSQGLSFLDDRRLLFADQLSDGWEINLDGTGLKPLPLDRRSVANVRGCGEHAITFERLGVGRSRVFVADVRTGAERQVAESDGEQTAPACTADGSTVFYSAKGVRKVAAAGGTPVLVWERGHIAEVSPDGSQLLLHAFTPKGETLTLVSAADGKPVRDVLPYAMRHFRWHPSGRAFYAILAEGGVDNLWEIPLDGSPRRQLTTFKDETLFRFDLTRDGRFVISRGKTLKDVVLMTR